jgi:rhamnose utilization protein RhaD (predicted bifunctional aldolase and dehydrogenase)/NAD(P)-dependent dehydrogenase (short-subunit alcohol dehydrogenase family)
VTTLLAERVRTSRLLGSDPRLVLHGGGNTSVKVTEPDVTGAPRELLYVKGSGHDLAGIGPEGFAPVLLDRLRALASLEELSDTDMARELRAATVDPAAPAPSVEAILHALIPAVFVDHTHADAVVTLSNSAGAAERLSEVYGDLVVVVPYVMPGFRLARYVAQTFPVACGPDTIGLVLMNHGIFSFGATASESYERMLHLVQLASDCVAKHRSSRGSPPASPPQPHPVTLVSLRREVSAAAGRPMVLVSDASADALSFARHPRVAELSQVGPATPDHVIRTKPVPLLGRDVASYAAAYEQYFEARRARSAAPLQMLDPAPRVILDPELGLCCAGRTPAEADITADVYRHTIQIILDADELGGYRPVSLDDLFDVEYWELEQAKLRRSGAPRPLAGEVALVTGAASGIGRACAAALLAEGAAVVGLDLSTSVSSAFPGPAWLGLECDVTDDTALKASLNAAVRRFGGLDILVVNAGVFPGGQRIADLLLAEWQRVMRVNVDSAMVLLHEAFPLLEQAPAGGRVVVIGSKNVPAPGPGAAAYSASKAALTQLGRVAALEWADSGIRVNVIHPNAVFDTGIWTEEVLRARAEQYGMTVQQYRTNNLLGVEVASADVAALCLAMVGPAFAKTTGAQVPVDGGNDRVI